MAGVNITSGAAVVALAHKQLGKPYVFDTPKDMKTANPPNFDCSGLTMWCYYQVMGVKLTHIAAVQYTELKHRPIADVQPGDLVFWETPIGHTAIYVGNGQCIEAPHTGANVKYLGLHDWITPHPLVGICPGTIVNGPPTDAGDNPPTDSIAGLDFGGISSGLSKLTDKALWVRVGLYALGILILALTAYFGIEELNA